LREGLVDLAVDEAFETERAANGVGSVAVEIELRDGDQPRRRAAGEKEPRGVMIVPTPTWPKSAPAPWS
jgi:hypothetical protein